MSGLGRKDSIMRGRVRAFSIRNENHALRIFGIGDVSIWSFRLERSDSDGNPMPVLPVVLRGPSIEGIVNDGDEVEVAGSVQDGILNARNIVNLSFVPPATIRARGKPFRNLVIAAAVLGTLLYFSLSTGFLFLLTARLAESAAVPLSTCVVSTRGGNINEHMFGMGTRIETIMTTSSQQFRALRRADWLFGTITQFEVESKGMQGWLDGVVEIESGDCIRQAPNDEIMPVVTPTLTGLHREYTEVPPEILAISTPEQGECLIILPRTPLDMYAEPVMGSAKIGVTTDYSSAGSELGRQFLRAINYYPLLLRANGPTGPMVYFDTGAVRGWVHETFVDVMCGQQARDFMLSLTPVPTPTQKVGDL